MREVKKTNLKTGVRLGLACVLMALVAACGHTPVASFVKLRNFDPATTDVKKLSVAVALPHEFRIEQEGVTMVLELKKKDGSEVKRETFVLTTSLRSEDKMMLAQLAKHDNQIIAYRVRPDDIDRFNDIRRFTLEKRASKQWEGSFSIGTRACRVNTELPKTAFVTTYLKTSETRNYVPLLVDVDLMKQPDVTDLETLVPVCDTV